MAQTTTATSQAGNNAVIEVNTNPTTAAWQDVSGSANSFEIGDVAIQTGEGYTFDGMTPVITTGKQEPIEVTIMGLYTKTATELWSQIKAVKDSSTHFCQLRITHNGVKFTTDPVYSFASSIAMPKFDATEAGPVPAGITVITASIAETVSGT